MSASDTFQQLILRFTDPIQCDFEVIRGITLADETIIERKFAHRTHHLTVKRFLERHQIPA
jgi:hypothetical protein